MSMTKRDQQRIAMESAARQLRSIRRKAHEL